VNIGITPHDLAPLLMSGQSFEDMWWKAYDVTGCSGNSFDRCAGTGLTPINEASACRNTCPDDPGRGLDLDPAGNPFGWVTRSR
jgi:hypothetical protein